MKHYLLIAILLFINPLSSLFAREGTLVISEIFYDSPLYEYQYGTGHEGGEFVELYNPRDEAVDISGWKLQGGDSKWERYTFASGTVIQPKEFILVVLLTRYIRFLELFPDIPKGRIFYQKQFILNNDGDEVILFNADEEIIDYLYYDSSLLATNGYTRRLGKMSEYLSIQRENVYGSWDKRYDSNDYKVDYANPFSNPSLESLEDKNWNNDNPPGFVPEQIFGSTMNGIARVSPTGGALYDIPIALPAGRNNIAPQLSISYNSQINDGILGPKWGLNGFSTIARVNRQAYFDLTSIKNAPKYGFSLDGIRMADIWNDNYILENDPYTTIKYDLQTLKFTVSKQDGTVLTYAARKDAASDINKTPYYWDIARIEDKNGNYITFKYSQKGDETFISRIEYTGNSKENLPPYYMIQFAYSRRSSGRFYYKEGVKVENTTWLSSISVFYKKNKIKEYSFTYINGYLSLIKEIVANGSKVSLIKIERSGKGDEQQSYSNVWKEQTPLLYGDFLGDCKEYGLIKRNNIYEVVDLNGNTKFTTSDLPSKFNESKSSVADLNGDGLADLVLSTGEGKCSIYLSDGKKFILSGSFNCGANYIHSPKIGDCNGDKIPEIVVAYRDKKKLHIKVYSRYGGEELLHKKTDLPDRKSPSIFSGDFNGDGKMDFAFNYKGETRVIYSFTEETFEVKGPFKMSSKNLSTGDFNGDGNTDFVDKRSNNQCAIYYSTQTGFTEENVRTFKKDYPEYAFGTKPNDGSKNACVSDIYFLDLDGDGKTEIIQLCGIYKPANCLFQKHWKMWDLNPPDWGDLPTPPYVFGNGSKPANNAREELSKEMQWITIRNENGHILSKIDKGSAIKGVGDFKGKGTSQLLIQKADESYVNFIYNEQTRYLTTAIKNNGTGITTNFDYKLLTEDANYHTERQNDNSTVLDVTAPMFVVKSISVPDGKRGMDKTNYNYSGLKYHTKGKGLLGFMKITATNEKTGEQVEQKYNLGSFYNLNLTSVTTSKGKDIRREIFEYQDKKYTDIRCVFGYSYMSYLNRHSVTDYINNNETTTSYTYNSNGLLTGQETNYNNESISSITLEYIKAAGIDKVSKRTESFNYNSSGNVSVAKEFTYDDKTGNMLSETLYPEKDKEVKKTYTYNRAGLPTSVSLKAKGEQERVTSYQYDSDLRFITKETDPLNHSIEKTYSLEDGLLSSVKEELTGHVVSYEYDELGRVKSIKDPWGAEQKITTDWASKAGEDIPSFSVYFIKTEKPNTPVQKEFYDVLGRKLRTVTERFKGKVTVDYEYNNLGQLERQSLPYSANSAPVWTRISYDDYDRATTQSIGEQTVSYSYGQNKITEISSSGQTSTKTVDALGNVIKVEDSNGNEAKYRYNSFKEIAEITTPDGKASISYDEYGRKKEMNDPNAGKVTYQYNALGQLVSQTDANGNVMQTTYDKAGRILTKTTPEGTTHYTYNKDELLESVVAPNGTAQYYTYNDKRQILTAKELINGVYYTTSYEYDNYGNNTSIIYPSGFTIYMEYTPDGILQSILTADGTPVWTLDEMNAYGQITEYMNGNGLKTVQTFDKYGRINSIVTDDVQNLVYEFDTKSNNILKRSDLRKGLSESFEYDNLNRLSAYQIKGFDKIQMSYTPTGNISEKSDLGIYSYGDTQKNAVKQIVLSGDTLSLPEQQIDYTVFNKTASVSADSLREEFLYGPDEQRRVVNTYAGSDLVSSKIYSINYEKIITNGHVMERNYINTPVGVTAVYITQDSISQMYYLCKDHQNSITAVISQDKKICEEYAYDPWGRRRNPQNWTYENIPKPYLVDRGYTMHEHMDAFGLINMNGRMYDPLIARVLSPDIFVSDPFSMQNYNRYSYCHNNPLIYVDPDGNNVIGWIGAGLIWLGKLFQDGRKANHGEPNPFKWDWEKANFTIGAGASGGGFNAYGGIGWNNNYGFAVGYGSEGISMGYTQNSTFHMETLHETATDPSAKVIKSINDARAINSWDYSSFAWASASLVLVADDWTGVGTLDDIAIPVAYVGATAMFVYDNSKLIAKQAKEIAHLLKRTILGPQGFTYELRATSDGYYKNVRGGTTYLKAGEVWKYGETTIGEKRYTKDFYETGNVKMFPIFFGNQVEILIQEKIMIYGYVFDHGVLPPGNKIFR